MWWCSPSDGMDECEDKMCEHPPDNWSSQGVSLFSEAVDVFILLGLFVVFFVCLYFGILSINLRSDSRFVIV